MISGLPRAPTGDGAFNAILEDEETEDLDAALAGFTGCVTACGTTTPLTTSSTPFTPLPGTSTPPTPAFLLAMPQSVLFMLMEYNKPSDTLNFTCTCKHIGRTLAPTVLPAVAAVCKYMEGHHERGTPSPQTLDASHSFLSHEPHVVHPKPSKRAESVIAQFALLQAQSLIQAEAEIALFKALSPLLQQDFLDRFTGELDINNLEELSAALEEASSKFTLLPHIRQWMFSATSKMGQTFTLDASNKGLKRLPLAIGKIAHLTHILIDNNRLKSLPGTVTFLTNLRLLRAHNNRLTSLPPGLMTLPWLGSIGLDRNRLKTLPDDGHLPKLQDLSLDHNVELQALPAWLTTSPDLIAIGVEGVQETLYIPPALQELTEDEDLND
ncbi:MAG: hypothetical protein SP1CHLAM54_07210 [Chlamydiia bacterium]|nr:hypothetical protein [Chlamydiia bacterium]MCH9615627.1 hypothetical protein [Chlamydiia bacterium]MCH9628970.1 hypothetical protein [Chlamydiia bacterium]